MSDFRSSMGAPHFVMCWDFRSSMDTSDFRSSMGAPIFINPCYDMSRQMSDFRSRLFEERTSLADKIKKLESFILSQPFEDLDQVDRKDLKEQLQHMKAYDDVLLRRVSRLCNNA